MPIQLLADLLLAEAYYKGSRQAWCQEPTDCDLEYRMEHAEGHLYDTQERVKALSE